MKIKDVPLTLGLDQSADKKVARPGTPYTLENYRADKTARMKQRPGYRQESGLFGIHSLVPMYPGLAALVPHYQQQNAPVVPGPIDVWVRDENGTWTDASTKCPVVGNVTVSDVWATTGEIVRSHGMAVHSEYTLHAIWWIDSVSGVHYVQMVVRRGGMEVSRSPEYAGYKHPRVIPQTDHTWMIVAYYTAATTLRIWVFDTDIPVWTTPADLSAGIDDGLHVYDNIYDMVWPGGLYFYLACSVSSALVWQQRLKTTYAVNVTRTVVASPAGIEAAALSEDGLVVAFIETGGTGDVWWSTHTAGGVVVVAPAQIATATGASSLCIGGAINLDSNLCSIYYGTDSAVLVTGIYSAWSRRATCNRTTGAVTLKTAQRGWVAQAGPVLGYGGEYILMHARLKDSPTYGNTRLFVGEVYSDIAGCVPVVACENNMGTSGYDSVVHRGARVGETLYFPGVEWSETAEHATAKAVMVKCDIGNTVPTFDGVPGHVQLSGGLPAAFEPTLTVEDVPLLYPIITATAAGGTGITGTVMYKGVFQVQDLIGRLGWSAPSPATNPLVLVNQSVTVQAPVLYFSRMPETVRGQILLYRSTDGGPYHLVSRTSLDRTDADGYVTITDTMTDPTAQPVLYTEGGEVEHFCPPWGNSVTVALGRMWAASGTRVYYSKWLDDNYLPRWTDTFYLDFPAEVTGVVAVGEVVLFFCDEPESLYYLSGAGPDNRGQGLYESATFVEAEVGLPTEFGGHKSIVVVGHFCFFRSSRGIERLGVVQVVKNEMSEVISAPIHDILDAYPVVCSAVHNNTHSCIVWALRSTTANGDGVYPHALVWYDYEHNVWGTDASNCLLRGGELAADEGSLFVAWDCESEDATDMLYSGIWRTDETLGKDTPTTGNTLPVECTLQLSPIRLAGMMGWCRHRTLRLLGEHESTVTPVSCAGTLSVSLDDGVTWAYTATFTHAVANWTPGDTIDLVHRFQQQKGTSLTLKLVTHGVSMVGETNVGGWGPIWTALALEYEPLPGMRRQKSREVF